MTRFCDSNVCRVCMKLYPTRKNMLKHLRERPGKNRCWNLLSTTEPILSQEQADALDQEQIATRARALRKQGVSARKDRVHSYRIEGPLEWFGPNPEVPLNAHLDQAAPLIADTGTDRPELHDAFNECIPDASPDTTVLEIKNCILAVLNAVPQYSDADLAKTLLIWKDNRYDDSGCNEVIENGISDAIAYLSPANEDRYQDNIQEDDTGETHSDELTRTRKARPATSKDAEPNCNLDEHDLQFLFVQQVKVGVQDAAARIGLFFPVRKTYFVLHFFSGRRRHNDIQAQLEYMSNAEQYDIYVLSLDLAISKEKGNLADNDVILKWIALCHQGHILGIIAGPPCETWSVARYLAAENGERMPPPLRSESKPWGLPALTISQYAQLQVGSKFLQTALIFFHDNAKNRWLRSHRASGQAHCSSYCSQHFQVSIRPVANKGPRRRFDDLRAAASWSWFKEANYSLAFAPELPS